MALCIGTVVLIAPDHEALIAGIILMLVFLTNAASSLRIVFQLRVRNSLTIAVLTVQGILWGGVVVWGYLSGSGMVFLALGFTLTTALASLMQGALALRDARVTFRGIKSQCFELIRLGAPIAIGGLLVMGYGRIDQVLVFKLVGSKDAGLYAAAYRIYSQASFAPVSISTTFFALLTAAFIASRSRFRALYQTSLELLLAVSIGGLAIAITYASAITTLLYGKGFAPAASALPILMGAFVLVCVGYLQDLLIIIAGLQKRFVAIAALAVALNVGLNIVLLPRYGFIAAAWVTLATEAFVFLLRWLLLRSKLPARAGFGRIPRLVGSGAVLTGLLFLSRAMSVPLFPALLLWLLAYPALLFAAGALRMADVRLIMGREKIA